MRKNTETDNMKQENQTETKNKYLVNHNEMWQILTKVLNTKLEVKISNEGQNQDENNRCHTEDKQNMGRSWGSICFRREMEGVVCLLHDLHNVQNV